MRILNSSNNTIGGAACGAGNLIAGNRLDGGVLSRPPPKGNVLPGHRLRTTGPGTCASRVMPLYRSYI